MQLIIRCKMKTNGERLGHNRFARVTPIFVSISYWFLVLLTFLAIGQRHQYMFQEGHSFLRANCSPLGRIMFVDKLQIEVNFVLYKYLCMCFSSFYFDMPSCFYANHFALLFFRPAPTYETGQTRQFYHGRTETVSCLENAPIINIFVVIVCSLRLLMRGFWIYKIK